MVLSIAKKHGAACACNCNQRAPSSASRKCNQSAEVRASHPVQRPRTASRNPPDRASRSPLLCVNQYLRPRAHRPRIDHAHITPAHRSPLAHRPPLAQPTRSHIAPAHRTSPTAHRSHNRPRGTTEVPCCEYCTQSQQSFI